MGRRKRPTLYELLEVSNDATEEEIKKSYRKLALKLHPDKVRQSDASEEEVEQAEQRFKQVNTAYSVLSDKTRRNQYDVYGDEALEDPEGCANRPPPNQGGPGVRRRPGKGGGGGGANADYGFSDLQMEQLLAATLSMRRRRYSLLVDEPFVTALVQIMLPIAIVVALAVSPPSSTPAGYGSEAPFRVRPHGEYVHERKTTLTGVTYYVRHDFEHALGSNSWAVSAVEAAAESLHRESLRAECDGQRRIWQNAVNRARRTPKGPERDARVAEAEARPTPACGALKERHGEERALADAFKSHQAAESSWGRGSVWRVADEEPAAAAAAAASPPNAHAAAQAGMDAAAAA